jgi:hypothetical protein
VFRLMQKPFDPNVATDRDMNARVSHLVCYDAGFALYILVSIFQVVWLIIGAVWRATYGDNCDDSESTVMLVLMILTWVYIVVAAMVFLLSWCCSCFTTNLTAANQSFEASFFGAFLGDNRRRGERGGGGRGGGSGHQSDQQVPVTVAQPASYVSIALNQGHAARDEVGDRGGKPAVAVHNESDAEMARRLQFEEQGRSTTGTGSNVTVAQAVIATPVPPDNNSRVQPPSEPDRNAQARQAAALAGRGFLAAGRLGAAALGAAANAVAEERRRQQEEERRYQQQGRRQ